MDTTLGCRVPTLPPHPPEMPESHTHATLLCSPVQQLPSSLRKCLRGSGGSLRGLHTDLHGLVPAHGSTLLALECEPTLPHACQFTGMGLCACTRAYTCAVQHATPPSTCSLSATSAPSARFRLTPAGAHSSAHACQHAHTGLCRHGYASSLAPRDVHDRHTPSYTRIHSHAHGCTTDPVSPLTLMLRPLPSLSPSPGACSLIDKPVTDLAGQEDVRV